MLARILLPVDFSDRSAAAARYVIPLAEHFQSEVIVVHVLPTGSEVGSSEFGRALPPDVYADRQSHARHSVDAFLRSEMAHLKVKRIVLEGGAAERIVQHAHSEKCDLIAIPTHGWGAVRRLLLGSVAAKVLHDADCPVWTTAHLDCGHPPAGPSEEPILCAIDLLPHCSRPLEWSIRLARECGRRLSVLHVIPSGRHQQTAEAEPPLAASEHARVEVERLLRAAQGCAQIGIESGDVLTAICAQVRRLNACLLVIGRSPSPGALGRLRCHAYTIIRESPCPVVSV